MRNRGPDTSQKAQIYSFNAYLERVRQVEVVKDPEDTESPYYIDVVRDDKDYGCILTKEVIGDSNNNQQRYWVILLPKYLRRTVPKIPSDLRVDVFPAYNVGDQLFVGRLGVPISVQSALTSEQGKSFKNTHELVVNDYNQRNKNPNKGRQWNKVSPDVAAFFDHRVNNNPLYMAFYIDLNVDGRNRTPATTATSSAGNNAPNVWL